MGPCFGQLVIEGGPFGAVRSNRDGKVMGPVASSHRGGVSGVNVRPMYLSPSSASPYRIISPAGAMWYPAEVAVRPAASPLGTPYFQEIDIRKIQQTQKAQRELGVIRTTRQEEMVFPASRLFGPGQSALSQGGRALLAQVASYSGIGDYAGLRVSYQLDSRDSSQRALARSEAIVNYLGSKTGRSPGWFATQPPQRLDPESPLGRSGSLVTISLLRPVAYSPSVRD